jgi:hypothetical protein
MIFLETTTTTNSDRLNKCQFGYLKGKALRKAERIVDR